MKTLYICLTDYQLINAMNIASNMLSNEEADIILVNNKEGNEKIAERLEKTRLFSEVYLFLGMETNGVHRYLRNKTENKNGISVQQAIFNSCKNIKATILEKISGKEQYINSLQWKNKKIDFSQYNKVFCLDTREFIVDCVNLIKKYNISKTEVNLIDEGLFTYTKECLTKRFEFDYIYLYQPELAEYYDEYEKRIIKIGYLDAGSQYFQDSLKMIYQLNVDRNSYDNKIIFFDQNWDPMPKYLRNISGIKKLLFQNSYRKHKWESRFYDKKMELFRLFADKPHKNEVIVKLHPRSDFLFIEDYLKSNCTILKNGTMPWEVFCSDLNMGNNIWITVNSSALLSYVFSFKNFNPNIRLIFLYKLFVKDTNNEIGLFTKLAMKFPNNIIIPTSNDEFLNVLENS